MKINKHFLYLVQSRIKNLDRYPELESDDADVIFATFEKKIDKPNYIYIPNTVWAEGRNALTNAARKLPHQYQYYILLDDDLVFINGSFKEFEQTVLAIEPDFSSPNCSSDGFDFIKHYNKIHSFDYSKFIFFDSPFICLSSELFFSSTILPYHTAYQEEAIFQNSFYQSRLFWMNLFEYFSDKNLLVINNIKVINIMHITTYNSQYCYSYLRSRIKKDNPSYTFRIEKAIPGIYMERLIDKIPYFKGQWWLSKRKLLIMRLLLLLFKLFLFPWAIVQDIKLKNYLKKTH